MGDLVFVLIVALRVLVPLATPRIPLPAIVAALVIDAADQTVLAAFDAEPDNYQGYDKALDVYYLAIAYLSTIRNWPINAPFRLGQALWYYRLVGVVAFEFSGWRALLLIFPNTFEYFFIAYEGVRTRWDPARLGQRAVALLAAGIWVGIKLPQEWWIHIARLDFTDALDNPAFAVIVVVVSALVVAGAVHGLRVAPPADWAFSVDVDRTRTTVVHRPAKPTSRRWQLLDHPLVEKTVLAGLLVAVFSQVFEIVATVTQVVIACGFIVVVNSWATEFFRRRGTQWRNVLTEFVSLLAVNWGALGLYLWLRPSLDADLGFMPTLTMLGLLTLIVILYDNVRTLRVDGAQQP